MFHAWLDSFEINQSRKPAVSSSLSLKKSKVEKSGRLDLEKLLWAFDEKLIWEVWMVQYWCWCLYVRHPDFKICPWSVWPKELSFDPTLTTRTCEDQKTSIVSIRQLAVSWSTTKTSTLKHLLHLLCYFLRWTTRHNTSFSRQSCYKSIGSGPHFCVQPCLCWLPSSAAFDAIQISFSICSFA